MTIPCRHHFNVFIGMNPCLPLIAQMFQIKTVAIESHTAEGASTYPAIGRTCMRWDSSARCCPPQWQLRRMYCTKIIQLHHN